jgi:hypothetical protein
MFTYMNVITVSFRHILISTICFMGTLNSKILWLTGPLLGDDCKTTNQTALKQQQRNGVFCEVHAEMSQVGQLARSSVS